MSPFCILELLTLQNRHVMRFHFGFVNVAHLMGINEVCSAPKARFHFSSEYCNVVTKDNVRVTSIFAFCSLNASLSKSLLHPARVSNEVRWRDFFV